MEEHKTPLAEAILDFDFELEDFDMEMETLHNAIVMTQPQDGTNDGTIQDCDTEVLSIESLFDAEQDTLLVHQDQGHKKQHNSHQQNSNKRRRTSVDLAKQLWSPSSEINPNDLIVASLQPPAKRAKQVTPPPQQHSSISSSLMTTSHQRQYNELLSKLAESMKRSEQSRAAVIRQRKSCSSTGAPTSSSASALMLSQSSSSKLTKSAPSNHSASRRLSSFLSGSQSTLTSGLETSRRQLAEYMCQIATKASVGVGHTSPMA